ncbi:hypothetical protein F4678DRAFT_441441 [Xylaria arbuscula]|nr:hypothetical protein F4678DRAFT_441441 [Xylaria arbuscula]
MHTVICPVLFSLAPFFHLFVSLAWAMFFVPTAYLGILTEVIEKFNNSPFPYQVFQRAGGSSLGWFWYIRELARMVKTFVTVHPAQLSGKTASKGKVPSI